MYLWVEKHRPSTVDGYVWKNENMKEQINQMIEDRELPHLLLSGKPGTGKTTLAKILINAVGISFADVMEINGSTENGIDVIRNKITNFASVGSFSDLKVVLIDEADYISPNGQAGLRNLMETYSDTTRFILTCNYPNKIIPALKSRTQHFQFSDLDRDEFLTRLMAILLEEGMDINEDNLESVQNTLSQYVDAGYPDLRKTINLMQQNFRNQILNPLDSQADDVSEYLEEAIGLFLSGNINKARKLVAENARAEEYMDFFRMMYDKIVEMEDVNLQNELFVIIGEGHKNQALVADQEINFSATMAKIYLAMERS